MELKGNITAVKAGKMLPFTEALAQEHFDAKNEGDELTRWSQERSEAVAVANVSAAKTVRDMGGPYSLGLFANGMSPYGSWYYNPYYSMYTYLPMNGMFFNPYGYGFFSPYTVYQVYSPGYFYGGGGSGYGTGGSGTGDVFGQSPRPFNGTVFSARVNSGSNNGLGRTVSSPSGLSGASNTLSPMSGSSVGGSSLGGASMGGLNGGSRGGRGK